MESRLGRCCATDIEFGIVGLIGSMEMPRGLLLMQSMWVPRAHVCTSGDVQLETSTHAIDIIMKSCLVTIAS